MLYPDISKWALGIGLSLLAVVLAIVGAPGVAQAAWAETGRMAADRYGHAMTVLADGRVLVTGGADYKGSRGIDSSAELWDPATGRWAGTAGLGTPRIAHTATLLSDGRVLVAGGLNAGLLGAFIQSPDATVAIASAEVWDPATGRFSDAGAMLAGRSNHVAIALADGRVLFVGGSQTGRTGARFLDSAEVWDPRTASFSAAGRLPRPVVEATMTLLADGRVLLIDGEEASLWDPATSQWSAAGRLLSPRAGHTATLLADGRVLAVGGSACDGCAIEATAELWDPATRKWSAGARMAWGRQRHTAARLPDGRVLVVGGHGGGGAVSNERFVATAELWDPASGRWTPAGRLQTGRSEHTMALLPDGGVLIAGGLRAAGHRPEGSQVFTTLASAEVWRHRERASAQRPAPRRGRTG
jgi:hypothetical protein